MNELKPCPFCGGGAKIIQKSTAYSSNPTTIMDNFVAGCEGCGIYTPQFATKIWLDKIGELHIEYNGAEKATEAWNRRADAERSGE